MKRFVFHFIFLVVIFLTGIMAYNYHYDTSGLFDTDFSVKRVEPDQRFIKVKYLIENPSKYDAYCFGSSRVGNIDLTKICNGHRYYNMTYSEGLPEEWLEDIRILLKHNVEIRQIIVGIDDFSFKVDPKLHEAQYTRIPYNDDGNMKTYLSFLLKTPAKPAKPKEKEYVFDIYGTGRMMHEEADKRIEEDIEAHIRDEKFGKITHYAGNRIGETINALHELKVLCDNNNIDFIMFINPLHKATYLDNDLTQFNEFKRRLSEVADYYDFSGLSEITTNNYYYYETSHYRPVVGDMIIQRIFRPEKGADFGVYVTRDNVEDHIRMLVNEAREHRNN